MKKIIALISIILLVSIAFYWHKSNNTNQKIKYVTDEIGRGNLSVSISASGSLEALTTVEVGSQISGIILKLFVDYNDEVKEGQLLAQIDPSTYEAQLKQAVANLEGAIASKINVEAQMKNLRVSLLSSDADIQIANANLKRAQISLEDARRNFNRVEELYKKKLVAQSDADDANSLLENQKAALEVSKAQVDSAKARKKSIETQLEAEEAQIASAESRVNQMQAQLDIAEINLERCNIYSPIDGVIIGREIDQGQTVAASLQAPKLFVIAQDLKKMLIDTAVDEADIGEIRAGQKVKFSVDAYKNRQFHGFVKQVRLMPITSSNVVTYSVMVSLDNENLLLKPGMTANVEIITFNEENALRVPVRASYFKPPENLKQFAKEANDKTKKSTTNEQVGKAGQQRKFSKTPEEGNENLSSLLIWVLNEKGVPEQKKLIIGNSNFDFIQVLSNNVSEGEKVIIGIEGALTSPQGSGLGVRELNRATRRM